MNQSELASLKEQYSDLSEEELSELIEKSVRQPQSLTEAARTALQQLVAERAISVESVLRERNEQRERDNGAWEEKRILADKKSRVRTRVLGRVMGAGGLVAAGVIAVPSISSGHLGGLVAAVATAICAFWMLFFYKGD